MRTSSSAAAESKKTPPAKKSAAAAECDTPKTRRGKGRQPKNTQQSSGAEVSVIDVEEVAMEAEVTPPVKSGSAGKRTAAKSKTPASRRGTRRSSRLLEADEVNVEESLQKEDVVELKDGETGTTEAAARDAGEVEEVVVVDQGAGKRIEQSVDEKVSVSVGRSSGDDTEEGLRKEKSAGSGVEAVTKDGISNYVEESEKKQEAAVVLGASTTTNLKQEPDEEGGFAGSKLPPPVNADKNEAIAIEVEVPSITNADVSSEQQEETEKNEDAATAMEVNPSASAAEVLLKQQEDLVKNEEVATAMEIPPIANPEVSVKEQEESCKKEETPIVLEVPPITNAEILLKQQEADKEVTAMELGALPDSDVSTKHEETDEKEQTKMEMKESSVANVGVSLKEVESSEDVSLKEGKTLEEVLISSKSEEARAVEDGDEVKGRQIEGVTEVDKKESIPLTVDVAEIIKSETQRDPHENAKQSLNDKIKKHGDRVSSEQREEDDLEEPVEETKTLEEEHRELTDAVKDRIMKKECEIFVGGLERDAVEDDLRKVFERIGEVLEVRLHKNLSTNKNKGYAFVRFANKVLAKRALEEMKNPVICGKQCGTAPCEDNNTLFLGNICNTWTKEAIRQKLKEYGIEGVGSINLVQDVQHEGLSRGFAFLEFSSHADALFAYRRLQKPDVVFGHPERTAKVAFAEPLREPDPEVMAQVKTVFLDGLPLHWDEVRIREQLKGYGEILRVVLAQKMSNAKRKDYGFVDFSTHDATVACINGVNNTELKDGNIKTKVKARLSNPLPKTQAVKGGICGGFLIGRGSGSVSKSGRNYGRGMPHFNRSSVQHGHGFHQFGRAGFPIANEHNNSYDFHGRQMLGRGGRRGSYRGGHAAGIAPSIPTLARPSLVRPWHAAPPDIGRGQHVPLPRQSYMSEGGFGRPFINNFDDPYLYDDNRRAMKRPLYMSNMTEVRPDYMEPSSVRPRIEYSDPAAPPPYGNRYPDSAGPSGSFYPRGYHGSNFNGGPGGGASRGRYPSHYGEPRPYNSGYY